jgi:hypothetical protein
MSPVRVLQQPIPLARSILWAPTSAPRPGNMPFPVFLSQSALQAIHEHLATPPPPGQGIVGFMLGDRCECPISGVGYSVIDAALRLNQTIYGDRTLDVVTRLWKRLEAQLQAQRAHLIGWYQTHAPLPLEMSIHDVETHQQYFSQPWQVGVVVGTDPATPAGAFFRAARDENWVRTPQPFYELLNDDSVRPDGKKRSFMTWKTYRAYNPPALQPRAGTSVLPSHVQPEVKRAVPRPPPPAPAPPPQAPLPPPPPLRMETPEEQLAPEGLENMPQAELEEPARTELEEPAPAPAPPQPPPREEPEETAEWEDTGVLKFLSAAEDMAAAPTRAPVPEPPAQPTPPPVFPAAPAPTDWDEQPPLEDEPAAEEPSERSAPPLPQPPAPRRRSTRRGRRRWGRIVALVMIGLVVAAGWVAYQRFGLSVRQRLSALIPARHAPKHVNPPRPVAPAPPVAAPAPRPARTTVTPSPEFAPLDQAGDSLILALQGYGRRARLFEKRRLDCSGLARGLVRVERTVATYGVQRGATRATLGPDRVARDRELRAGVDSAGRQFQQSGCERL